MDRGYVIDGKYVLDEQIGRGAIGEVWRATHLGLDRKVAIKLLRPSTASDPDAWVRFAREARVAATLDHPAAVAVLDFGEAAGTPYLVMELLVGQTLRDRMEVVTMPIAQAAAIAADVASALAAAHRISLVHRDIKPENIFLDRSTEIECVRVVDFGLAFIIPPAGHDGGLVGRLTSDGSVSGTPAYMAPEQIRGEGIGPACDIYALGCVLYEMITGAAPFAGGVAELFTRHVYSPPVPLRHAAVDRAIDPLLDELVLAMLAKSPLMRPTLEQIQSRLDALAGRSTARFDRTGAARGIRSERLAAPSSAAPPAAAATPVLAVRWVGPLDPDLVLALASNSIEATTDGSTGPGTVVYAPGATPTELAALVEGGARVVTDVAVDDIQGLTSRLRAGVVDAVIRPVRADDLVRKLRRASPSGTRRGPVATTGRA